MVEYDTNRLFLFLTESLAIEGIIRLPTEEEVIATLTFLKGDLTIETVIELQKVYVLDQPLRDQMGMNVQVGNHVAPAGGPWMRDLLEEVLLKPDAYSMHIAFETLHPFCDGNGRTGRAIWVWKMLREGHNPFSLGFLHRFYYQTLERADGRKQT